MTTEDLYSAILSLKESTELGFAAISKRFDGVDQRFDGIDMRLDRIDVRLGRLTNRVEDLESGHKAMRADIVALTARRR